VELLSSLIPGLIIEICLSLNEKRSCMAIKAFPPVDEADEHGLLAVGGDLEVSSLLLAYSNGIFPWPLSADESLLWFSPAERAVLFVDDFHISKSLKTEIRRSQYTYRINSAFSEVIEYCSDCSLRANEEGTWIIDEMKSAYIALHRAGYAHSFECYEGNELVGGLYGVAIGSMFAGESMFHRKDNTSKLSLVFLMQTLKKLGAGWLDCQQMTPLIARFGARMIPRDDFIPLLDEAISTAQPNLFDALRDLSFKGNT
jgi:leucyl/phenylalanyl-tRNA--protein transferase